MVSDSQFASKWTKTGEPEKAIGTEKYKSFFPICVFWSASHAPKVYTLAVFVYFFVLFFKDKKKYLFSLLPDSLSWTEAILCVPFNVHFIWNGL